MKKRILAVLLTVTAFVALAPLSVFDAKAADSRVEAAINWAIGIANDNTHGYSQTNRYGPDYDCSSLVSTAFNYAGFNVACTLNTRTMQNAFVNAGFTWIPASNIAGFPSSCSNLERGDILLASGHTELYIGNGKNVGAHDNYNGIPGGIGGGSKWSSGYNAYRYGADEIDVCNYWNDNWLGVLRYNGTQPSPTPDITYTSIPEGSYNIVCKSSGLYLNAYAWPGQATSGTDICVSNNDGTAEQKFRIQHYGNNQYYIRSLSNSNEYCVNAHADAPTNGTEVRLYYHNTCNTKHWCFESVGDGYYIIRNVYNTNLVLTADSNATRANVAVRNYTGNDNQKWKLQCFDHQYNSGTVTASPSCTSAGTKTYTCTACGATKTESVAQLGHSYYSTIVAPTTSSGGYTTHTCSRCGDSYTDSYTEPTAITYYVKYNANGGTGTMANSSHTFGVSKALSANKFTRTGYIFLGWSKTKNATTASYVDGKTVSGLTGVNGRVVNLYAIWKPINYSVKYNANGGTGTMSNSSHTFGTAKALTANKFTRTGYTFIGWSKTKNATTATYTNKQAVKGLTGVNGKTVVLYAVWKPNTYTVKYHAHGGTGTMSNSTHTYGTAKTLNANKFTRTGYTFLGWSASVSATSPTYTNKQAVKNLTKVNGNTVTLYAVWKPNTYTVKYHAHGGTGTMSNSTHTYGTEKALNANKFTRTGYTFLGWSASVSATSPTYTNKQAVKNLTKVNGNTVTLYAVWKPIKYTVKYNANGGTGTMANSSHTFGTAKALTANKFTRTGYIFLGWSKTKDAATATYTNKQTVSGLTGVNGKVVNLYAVWVPVTYKVAYNANGGTGTMSNSSHIFDADAALSANKFTRSGYKFLGWSKTKNATTATYTNKQVVKGLTGVQGKTVTLYAVWQKK